LIYRNAPHSAYGFIGQSAQELVVVLHQKLDEHLHACCGIEGARVLSSPA